MRISALCTALVAVFLFAASSANAKHQITYKGWTSPDKYCFQLTHGIYIKNCIKAQRVVYNTFPTSTRQAAMQTASCETGRTFDRWATNPSSRTAGIFQIHPGNHGTTWHWKGHGSVTIDRSRLYNSWYNAKVALYMSEGGTNWYQWAPVCRP